MSEIVDPKKLARTATLSRQLAAAGAPPMVSRPIVVDEDGYAFGLCPSDPDASQGDYIHDGVRVSWVPMPLQNGLLLGLFGGREPDPEFQDEGTVIFMTRDSLRRLAADLQAIADASVAS